MTTPHRTVTTPSRPGRGGYQTPEWRGGSRSAGQIDHGSKGDLVTVEVTGVTRRAAQINYDDDP
ncbi:hypothetical protein ACFY93_07440 [Streptomyces sp. NPDC008313]|uniref:hypothetical protein n=1 Tax=Streptomyces sp. NPDC008313 TaxID=3364826 RepID=UPI0036E28139